MNAFGISLLANPKILKLVTNSSIEDVVRKVKEQEEAKKFKTEYFAKMVEELDDVKKGEN